MKPHRWILVLTVLNSLTLVVLLLSLANRASAQRDVPVLRGRSLEIVDAQGRVRASIKIHPAETFKPTGRKYADTVMFRLIDPKGRPEVKIGASEEGGGLSFVGRLDATQVHLEAMKDECLLRLVRRDGRERVVVP